MSGITITILLDSGAASNHIKRELVCKLNLLELDRAIPLIINGFGDTKSKIITKIAQINLLSNIGLTGFNYFVILSKMKSFPIYLEWEWKYTKNFHTCWTIENT